MTQGGHTSSGVHCIEAPLQDVKHGIRSLSKAPAFTAAVVMALALGIGASVAIFSVVNAVLLRPLPYPDPDRIVILGTSSPAGPVVSSASPVEFNFWREQATTLQDISAYRFGRISMTGGDRPEQIRSALVTAAYFHLFGQKVALGRTFTPEEDRPEGADVVVLSSAFWRRAFGGDPGSSAKRSFWAANPPE
jgi:putative ABC transport system permease protein